jgi:hypothetical protein
MEMQYNSNHFISTMQMAAGCTKKFPMAACIGEKITAVDSAMFWLHIKLLV